jgi:hypothetical protein
VLAAAQFGPMAPPTMHRIAAFLIRINAMMAAFVDD